MAYARPKPDANGEFVRQRYTELSDVIRARNKVEDRLLNIRLKFYEREKKIRLNIIRREQHQLERVRSSLFIETPEIRIEKEVVSSLPSWLDNRPKSENKIFQLTSPELSDTNWLLNSNVSPIVSSTNSNSIFTTIDHIRPHTTQ